MQDVELVGRQMASGGQGRPIAQRKGSAVPTPAPQAPIVGAVTPSEWAYVALPYVMPLQPQTQESSPVANRDGRGLHVPSDTQSGASQYSSCKH
jgi:hypothetical protein